ncbi:MAG: hypothetical protein AB1714_00405 [Acidobacteriota bacterium]
MFRQPLSGKEKVLRVLYAVRMESASRSMLVEDISVKTGIDASDVQEVIQCLLESGFVKTATPMDPSQISTWVKITKAGRDYLREKALVA